MWHSFFGGFFWFGRGDCCWVLGDDCGGERGCHGRDMRAGVCIGLCGGERERGLLSIIGDCSLDATQNCSEEEINSQ